VSVRTYSDATLLEKLVIGRWDIGSGIWRNEGNTTYSGIATGTVTSTNVSAFGTFTLASTVASENPLPIQTITLNGRNQNGYTTLYWLADSLQHSTFEILRSDNKVHFIPVGRMNSLPNKLHYEFSESVYAAGLYYYQLRVKDNTGRVRLSNVVSVAHKDNFRVEIASPIIRGNILAVTISNTKQNQVTLFLLDGMGRTIRNMGTITKEGTNPLLVNIGGLPAGLYYLAAISSRMKREVLRIVKL
jgi:hypothetical protein